MERLMLEIKDLSYHFGVASLRYTDWNVAKGEHAVILGASGSGKTTLLHLIGGLLKAQKGSIKVDNEEMSTKSQLELDRFRKERIGIVFQLPHLIKALTVAENILLAQFLAGRKPRRQKVDEVLEQLGIGMLAKRKVTEISQGQAQRVAIARAIVNMPALLLADEPTASLDDESCTRVLKLLQDQSDKNGSTLIVATHDKRVRNVFKSALVL